MSDFGSVSLHRSSPKKRLSDCNGTRRLILQTNSLPYIQTDHMIGLFCDCTCVWCNWLCVIAFRVNLYSKCLKAKEHLAQNRRDICKLSVWKRTRTQNDLVCKQVLLQSLKLHISHLFWARISLTFRQLQCRFTLNAYAAW